MNSVEYEIKESARAKHVRITIHTDGRVVATKPSRVSLSVLERFVQEKQEWIEMHRARIEMKAVKTPLIELPRPRRGSRAYKEAVTAARSLATDRLAYFNDFYGFTYGSISIRNQKTRWGSCSARNNLSFNYKIAFLPSELADYIIVHELCHTKEYNHSDKFWAQVARQMPSHGALRKLLRTRYTS